MSRQLVITADDVGVDDASIHAAAELVAGGHLSSVSVIPMAAGAHRALDVLASVRAPRPDGRGPAIGLHATFTSDQPGSGWGPVSQGGTLVRPGTSQFHRDVREFAAAADPTEVLVELRAQIGWLGARGVRPTHLDSHHGALYGLTGRHFMDAALLAAAEHGIALRLPRIVPRQLRPVSPSVRLRHRAAVAVAEDLGICLPETIVTDWRPESAVADYVDLRDYYISLVRSLPDGLSELFVHPAADPGPGAPLVVDQRKRLWEFRLLRDDLFGATLAAEGVEVVPWPPARIAMPEGATAG